MSGEDAGLMAVRPEHSFSIESDSEDRKTPPCNPLCFPVFLVVILYGQLLHGLCAVLLLVGIRVSPHVSGDHTLSVLNASFATAARSQPVIDDTQGPVMFLCNHRSWGDFLLDSALLGAPSFVSRCWAAVKELEFRHYSSEIIFVLYTIYILIMSIYCRSQKVGVGLSSNPKAQRRRRKSAINRSRQKIQLFAVCCNYEYYGPKYRP